MGEAKRRHDRMAHAINGAIAALYDVQWVDGFTVERPEGDLYFEAGDAQRLWQGMLCAALEKSARGRSEAVHG